MPFIRPGFLHIQLTVLPLSVIDSHGDGLTGGWTGGKEEKNHLKNVRCFVDCHSFFFSSINPAIEHDGHTMEFEHVRITRIKVDEKEEGKTFRCSGFIFFPKIVSAENSPRGFVLRASVCSSIAILLGWIVSYDGRWSGQP